MMNELYNIMDECQNMMDEDYKMINEDYNMMDYYCEENTGREDGGNRLASAIHQCGGYF
jgi:hypothetical protein